MQFNQVQAFIAQCQAIGSEEIYWCDKAGFYAENAPEVAPGGYINQYGYYVIGTTIGGNALVISARDTLHLADHTGWYDDFLSYLAPDGKWCEAPYTAENVAAALYDLADARNTFLTKLKSGEIDQLVNKLD